MENKYLSRHVILSLILGILGILMMWQGNALVSTIGSVLLISGIYTIMDNYFLKKSLIELVIEKVKLDKEIDDAGLFKIDSTLTNIDYKNLFENAEKNIDILHNYGRTWTTNYYDFIKETVLNKECNLRVILLNPDSEFVPALEKHYEYKDGQLREYINEVTEKWKMLCKELNRKKESCKRNNTSSYKNKKCGSIEIYYFNGQPTNSIYRIDDKVIVVSTKTSREKSIHLPYAIYQNCGEKGMYGVYINEIDHIIEEATKICLDEI